MTSINREFGKEKFLTTETCLCNIKWICTTKCPHYVLFSNTYNFRNV